MRKAGEYLEKAVDKLPLPSEWKPVATNAINLAAGIAF